MLEEYITCDILSTDSTDRPASLSETVVPARNLAMLSVAVSLAVRHRCSEVLFAAHQGDSAVYPDCRPGFVRALNEVTGPTYGVQIRAPYLTVSKAALVAWGKQLDAPLHVAWSCYEGGEKACGNCGACRARREAGA